MIITKDDLVRIAEGAKKYGNAYGAMWVLLAIAALERIEAAIAKAEGKS